MQKRFDSQRLRVRFNPSHVRAIGQPGAEYLASQHLVTNLTNFQFEYVFVLTFQCIDKTISVFITKLQYIHK
jgi:hypothetical protein